MHATSASATGGRFAFFANLAIKTKIILGFATVLVILGVVGGSGLWSSLSVTDRFAAYDQMVGAANTVDAFNVDFQRLRRRVLIYTTSGADADYKAAQELAQEVKGRLDTAIKTVKAPERAAILRTIAETHASYSKQFEEAAALERDVTKLEHEVLDILGPKMAGELQDIAGQAAVAGNSNAAVHAQTALQSVMEVRLYANKALAEHDPALVAKVNEAFARLSKSMNALEAASAGAPFLAIVKAVGAEDEKYDAAFEKVWDEKVKIDTLVNKSMKEAADKIAADAEKLADALANAKDVANKAAESTLATAELTAVLLSLAGLGIGIALAWLLGSAISAGIVASTHIMAKLAEGDDSIEVAATDRKDEIGQMTRALIALGRTVGEAFKLRQMVENMTTGVMLTDTKDFTITYANRFSIEMLRKLQHLLPIPVDKLVGSSVDVFHKNPGHQRRILADPRNLPHRAKIKLGEETLQLNIAAVMDRQGGYIGPMLTWDVVTSQVRMANRVAEVVNVVSAAATEMQTTAQSMSATAEETSKQAGAVAAASEEAATNVQTVAAAAEELSASIAEIGRQVKQSSTIAAQAVADAETSNKEVQGLAEAAQKIGEVVSLINTIASQTNLLALNATIEAARAGDAGKGFAVVASEVKSLANQTAKATEEIGGQISAVQSATQSAVAAIKKIGERINELAAISSTIAAAVEEQGAATKEISGNVAQAAQGTQEVNSNIAGVNTAASETGQAAGQVLSAAGELAQNAEILNGEISSFLNDDGKKTKAA